MIINEQKLETFVNRAVGDLSAGYGGVMVSIGNKLGLYKAMRDAGPVSSDEVAKKTGCSERYIREWLNSQVAGEYIDYHPESKTYELNPEQAVVLADDDSPYFIPNAWNVPASMWFDEPKALNAFRNGEGVAWSNHHDRLYCGVAAFFRNCYRGSLVSQWLPALDGIIDKLEQGAHVADIGCGHGHSTLIMAESFPNSRFLGIDTHADSITTAQELSREQGLDHYVNFTVGDAYEFENDSFDLICFFDCLHDMGDPHRAATQAAKLLKSDGSVMLIEPFAEDKVENNINPVGRLYYSASSTLCCAHAISENATDALGAQAGESRLGQIFRQAGFSHFERRAQTPFNLIFQAKL